MLNEIWHSVANFLSYVPFAILFITAFEKSLRFSKPVSYGIMVVSGMIRMLVPMIIPALSETATKVFNYLDFFLIMIFALVAVNRHITKVMFVGLMLKNTADATVVFSKFAEHMVNPNWADLGYNWSYSVALLIIDLILFPVFYHIIRTYFTRDIQDSISDPSWYFLWTVPFFFYLTWLYIFYYSSEMTDLEIACLPLSSLYLLCSLWCQNFIYICLARMVESRQAEARLTEEKHAAQIQAVQYEHLNEQIQADRRLRHDFRHHLTTISALMEKNDTEHLKKYLAEYVSPIIWQSQVSYCGNVVLNITASYYANKCNSNNIDCDIHLDVPNQLPLSDSDITILFGNLLENALDSCLSVPENEPRKLTFLGGVVNHSLVFSIENTYRDTPPKKAGRKIMSTKHAGYGIGVASAMDIVEAHGGTISFDISDTFCARIILQQT